MLSCSVLCFSSACAVAVVAGAFLLVPRGACSSWLTGVLCLDACVVSVGLMKHAWLWFASIESNTKLHGLIPDCAEHMFCHYHIFPLMVMNYMSDLKCAWSYIFESASQDVFLFFILFMYISKECLQYKSILLFMCVFTVLRVCVCVVYI